MDATHRGQWIGRLATFLARFGVEGLDQMDEWLPVHHNLHITYKYLPLVCFLAVFS